MSEYSETKRTIYQTSDLQPTMIGRYFSVAVKDKGVYNGRLLSFDNGDKSLVLDPEVSDRVPYNLMYDEVEGIEQKK